MLMTYLHGGILSLIGVLPKALITFLIYLIIKLILNKKIKINLFSSCCEFMWFVIIFSILSITGVLYADFSITSIFNSDVHYSFNLLDEGVTVATILNIVLFVPFGFLSAIIFKRLRNKLIYGVLIGFGFSCIIEFLQTFTGRFVQIEDIIMNTLGTFIGYIILKYLFKILDSYKNNCSTSS